jgi:hypothetical protein
MTEKSGWDRKYSLPTTSILVAQWNTIRRNKGALTFSLIFCPREGVITAAEILESALLFAARVKV